MDKSSRDNFLINLQGPSRRTIKRRMDKLCSSTGPTHNKTPRIEVSGTSESSHTKVSEPSSKSNNNFSENIHQQAPNIMQPPNLLNDIENNVQENSPSPELNEITSDNSNNNFSENINQQAPNVMQAPNILNDIENIGFHVEYNNLQENSPSPALNEIPSDNIENFDSISFIFEDSPDENVFENSLRLWSLQYNIKNKALSDLLKLLKTYKHPDLPSDARTLKRTPRGISSKEAEPGRYWHFGIKKFIELLKSRGIVLPTELTINVNIDGLPIYNSSKSVFWPILGSFSELKYLKPFVIGVYFHQSLKPKNLYSYLEDFVSEMKFFSVDRFCGVKVHPGFFIMDAPATALIKQTIGHNGKKACGKCEITGDYVGRMCFSKVNNTKARTDEEFRLGLDSQHHLKVCDENGRPTDVISKSPLLEIEGVDMIDSFAIDSLHVIFLGAVKKKLVMIHGKLKFPINELLRSKFSKTDHDQIRLIMCSAQMSKPSEFNRAIRSLEYVSHYKGSEFRNFLLYHGMVALKGNVSKDIYENFLTLHCAVTICSTNKHRQYIHVAKTLFEKFVNDYKKIYGRCMTSHNIHQLLHIADYVLKFGALDHYSAFPFESKLGVLKNLISSGNNPLEQLANRIVEHIEADVHNYITAEKKRKNFKPIAKSKSIRFSDFILKKNDGDKWFLTKSKEIVAFEEVKMDSNAQPEKIVGRKIESKTDFYNIIGMRSSFLDIYQTNEMLSDCASEFNIDEIENKLFCIQDLNNIKTFYPILNTDLAL